MIPELDLTKVDKIVEKGQDSRVEMYSAFYDPLKEPRVSDSGLATLLKSQGISDCFVVGLAADYCVKSTAEDAAREGFKSWIIEEGTRAVDAKGWEDCKKELKTNGVHVISMDSPEIKRVG